jgi:guanylate kinase
MKTDHLFIISAPSQTGKDAIISRLLQIDELNLGYVVTTTTRERRPKEVEGMHYFFVSKEEFKQMIDRGEVAEYNEHFDHFYGITHAALQQQFDRGKRPLLKPEVNGMLTLRKAFSAARVTSIFIMPESIEQLEGRMRKAGFPEDDIGRRLTKAKDEMAMEHEYDFSVVNLEGRLAETVAEVADIIRSVDKN